MPTKIGNPLRGIVLDYELYGRGEKLYQVIPAAFIASDQYQQSIFTAVDNHDALSLVSDVSRDLHDLLQIRRGSNEAFRAFQLRFAAQVATFNGNGAAIQFPESSTALIPLANASVDSAQRVSILPAVSRTEKLVDPDASNDAYIKMIKYESNASILRQCDNPHRNQSST